MFGSSLGGMITFYLLPDLEGVSSALCHNWFYPGDTIDPSRSWLHTLSRFVNLFAPQLPVPMNILLDRKMMNALFGSSFIVDYFTRYKNDLVFCHSLTLLSMVSCFGGYSPKRPYSEVSIPTMGLIAEKDGMLPLELSRTWWEKASIPKRALRVIPGAQHMIFHDSLTESLPIVVNWFRQTIE